MSNLLHAVCDGRVLRVTLNRPDKRNALDAALCRELVDTLETAEQYSAVGSILLAGNGKAFCAGMDLTEIEMVGDTAEINALHERLFTVGSRLTKPVIAAVHGTAVGGGTGLVANCHIVVAAPDATFGLTEIRLGLWPFLIYRSVAAALGERRTTELALTGRTFSAAEAREITLVHQVADNAPARAFEIAKAVADFSPFAVQKGLDFVQQVRGSRPTEAGEIAQRVRNEVFAGQDFKEGLRAFREKRPPRWPSIQGL